MAPVAALRVTGGLGLSASSALTTLRIELPEILRIHPLEVLFQLVRLERRVGRGLVGLDAALVEQLVAGEDRGAHPERERDAVGGPGIHLEDVVVAPDEELGEVGVLLDRA